MDTPNKIIFFDGDCMLCNRFIMAVIKRNIKGLYFSELQSNFANKKLAMYNVVSEDLNTIYFLNNDKLYNRSTAILKIAAELSISYKILGWILIIVPKELRDRLYDLVSRNRYLFVSSQCHFPTTEQRNRILK